MDFEYDKKSLKDFVPGIDMPWFTYLMIILTTFWRFDDNGRRVDTSTSYTVLAVVQARHKNSVDQEVVIKEIKNILIQNRFYKGRANKSAPGFVVAYEEKDFRTLGSAIL